MLSVCMKVALFGGTFDPIHRGHLTAAESVLEFTDCEEVWFVPVYWHVFKTNTGITDIVHRKKMIGLAIEGKPGIKLVDFNENPTYTIDTIHKAKNAFPDHEFVWVIGSNLIDEFPLWKDTSLILAETKIIIVPEPGFEKLESELFSEEKGTCKILWDAPRVELDSTRVRKKLLASKSVEGLIDSKVINYIKEKGLYRQA